jgi:hypothetical protein
MSLVARCNVHAAFQEETHAGGEIHIITIPVGAELNVSIAQFPAGNDLDATSRISFDARCQFQVRRSAVYLSLRRIGEERYQD